MVTKRIETSEVSLTIVSAQSLEEFSGYCKTMEKTSSCLEAISSTNKEKLNKLSCLAEIRDRNQNLERRRRIIIRGVGGGEVQYTRVGTYTGRWLWRCANGFFPTL